MPGVKAILTADDLPVSARPRRGHRAPQRARLTNEPLYQGEPILAVAAVDELTAAEAIERIQSRLRAAARSSSIRSRACGPDGAERAHEGNVWVRRRRRRRRPPAGAAAAAPSVETLKWTDADFAAAEDGQLPMGKAHRRVVVRRSRGGLQGGRPRRSTRRSSCSPPAISRSRRARAMAYWQNGKLYLHGSTQSIDAHRRSRRATGSGIDADERRADQRVHAAAASAARAPASVSMAIPALLSKKAERAGDDADHAARKSTTSAARARRCMARVKVGFRKDGRITALDAVHRQDNGPYGAVGDSRSAGDAHLADLSAAGDAVARRRPC